MDWNQLKNNCCPRCTSKLESHGMLADFKTCSNPHCLFKIGNDKFYDMQGRMKARESAAYDPDENLSALNNL